MLIDKTTKNIYNCIDYELFEKGNWQKGGKYTIKSCNVYYSYWILKGNTPEEKVKVIREHILKYGRIFYYNDNGDRSFIPFREVPDDLNKIQKQGIGWNAAYKRVLSETSTSNILTSEFNKNFVELSSWDQSVRYKKYGKVFEVDPLIGKKLVINRGSIEKIDASKTNGCSLFLKCAKLKELITPTGTDIINFSNKCKGVEFPNFVSQGILKEFALESCTFKVGQFNNVPKATNYTIKSVDFGDTELSFVDAEKIIIRYISNTKNLTLKASEQISIQVVDQTNIKEIKTHFLNFSSLYKYPINIERLNAQRIVINPHVRSEIIIDTLVVDKDTKRLLISFKDTYYTGDPFVIKINSIVFEDDAKEIKINLKSPNVGVDLNVEGKHYKASSTIIIKKEP